MSRFIAIDQNPAPDGAAASSFNATDGATLRIAFFPAAVQGGTPRGTIIVEPGWAEFIEKYFEVATDLNRRGFNVAMMDWRGQGLSERPRQWSGYFDQLTDDLKEFRDGPVAAHFAPPYFLLTHSMGGLPGLLLLAQGYEGFERAVMSAPLTRMFPGVQNALLGALASGVCMLGGAGAPAARGKDDSRCFEGNMYTKDATRHERFRLLQEAAPEAALNAPTYGWVRETMRVSKRIHRPGFFTALKTPIRLISAGEERRIDGADHAVIAAANPLIEHRTIDGALHEIMMEADEYRDAFWAETNAFLFKS